MVNSKKKVPSENIVCHSGPQAGIQGFHPVSGFRVPPSQGYGRAGKSGMTKALVAGLGLIVPVAAGAQSYIVKPPSTVSTVGDVMTKIFCPAVDWTYSVAIIASIVFILVAAYKYITSGGEPEKTKSAKNALIYALVGIAVAVLAKGAPLIIGSFFSAPNANTNISSVCSSN